MGMKSNIPVPGLAESSLAGELSVWPYHKVPSNNTKIDVRQVWRLSGEKWLELGCESERPARWRWNTYSQVDHEVLALAGFLPPYHQREGEVWLMVIKEERALNGSFLFQGI